MGRHRLASFNLAYWKILENKKECSGKVQGLHRCSRKKAGEETELVTKCGKAL